MKLRHTKGRRSISTSVLRFWANFTGPDEGISSHRTMSEIMQSRKGIPSPDEALVYPAVLHKPLTMAFRQHGIDALHHFSDASFALHEKETTILGRGSLSSTPLYYQHGSRGRVTVSTRFRELVATVDSNDPDPAAIRDYLCYGFVPAPRTPLKLIGSVSPGELIRFDWATGQTVQRTLSTTIADGVESSGVDASGVDASGVETSGVDASGDSNKQDRSSPPRSNPS